MAHDSTCRSDETSLRFLCVPLCRRGIRCDIQGYPKIKKDGAPQDELKNGSGRGWAVPGSASSEPTTEFAQPSLSRSNGSHPQREGTNLGVFVPIWLALPRCEATHLGVLICVISTYSNGAVQLRVVWSSLIPFLAFRPKTPKKSGKMSPGPSLRRRHFRRFLTR